MLAGHDWQYTWGGSGMTAMDSDDVTTKFWFDGYSDPNPPILPARRTPAAGSDATRAVAAEAPTATRA